MSESQSVKVIGFSLTMPDGSVELTPAEQLQDYFDAVKTRKASIAAQEAQSSACSNASSAVAAVPAT